MAAVSVAALAFTGVDILMVHPRLYWGDAGNDLTPALIELPISRNYQHGGWTRRRRSLTAPGAPSARAALTTSSTRTAGGAACISWPRGCWCCPGIIYVLSGFLAGHFRRHVWPRRERARRRGHRGEICAIICAAADPGAERAALDYGLLQKVAYSFVRLRRGAADGLDGAGDVTRDHRRGPVLLRLFGGHPVRTHASTSSPSPRCCCS